MADSQHTPGPWRLHVNTSTVVCSGPVGPQHIRIADCRVYEHRDSLANCEANARLITAAPDLLSACKFVAETAVSWQPFTPGDIALVKAAIAKAEGK